MGQAGAGARVERQQGGNPPLVAGWSPQELMRPSSSAGLFQPLGQLHGLTQI